MDVQAQHLANTSGAPAVPLQTITAKHEERCPLLDLQWKDQQGDACNKGLQDNLTDMSLKAG